MDQFAIWHKDQKGRSGDFGLNWSETVHYIHQSPVICHSHGWGSSVRLSSAPREEWTRSWMVLKEKRWRLLLTCSLYVTSLMGTTAIISPWVSSLEKDAFPMFFPISKQSHYFKCFPGVRIGNTKLQTFCMIWGFQGGDYEEMCLVWCYAEEPHGVTSQKTPFFRYFVYSMGQAVV
jgi:hypothetical protein